MGSLTYLCPTWWAYFWALCQQKKKLEATWLSRGVEFLIYCSNLCNFCIQAMLLYGNFQMLINNVVRILMSLNDVSKVFHAYF